MLKAGPFQQFIAELNPQSSPARHAFSNWLKFCAGPFAPVDRELLEQFFADILAYPHWNQNKLQMGQEVRSLIEQYNRFGQVKIDVQGLRFPEELQVIELDHTRDVIETLTGFLKRSLPSSDKFRLIEDRDERAVAIILRADRSLEVRCFDHQFLVREGVLEPLRKNLILHYTSKLELSSQHQHQVEIAPFVTARFAIDQGRTHGTASRGFMFQSILEMKGENLTDLPRLHLPLRHLEQFFVDRRTDREYQELVQKAERTLNLLRAGDAEAVRWAPTVLSRAETAHEQVYTEDHRLALLIRDLRHALPTEGTKPCPTLTPIVGSD